MGNILGEHVVNNTISNKPTPLDLPQKKKKNLGPLGACWFTSLVAKNFNAYLCFLPFLT
jgi:hypothetical protein